MDTGSTIQVWVSEGAPLVEVPDVIEQSQERAEQTLKDKGFEVKVEQEESQEDPGTVLRTDPTSGSKAEKNSEVTITVAKQMLSELPDQKGRTYDQAVQQLNAVGFNKINQEEVDSDLPKGTVVDMTPQGGTDQPKDVQITLKVSKGPQVTQIQIPADIATKQFKEVRDLLLGMGLTNVVQQGSDKEDATVITSNPAPGSMVDPNTPVTIITVGGTVGDQGGNPGGNPGGDQGGDQGGNDNGGGGFFD